jgi:hypothetical protein
VKERQLAQMERRTRKLLRRRHREAVVGLGKEPYRHAHFWADVAPRGQYLAVHERGARTLGKPPTGKRGRITTFSRRSRSRMFKCFGKTNRGLLSRSLFLTLTYPRSFPSEAAIYKEHFRAWRMRLTRTFPSAGAIWRLEFQKRGAPHFHLLVVGIPFIAKEWVSRSWYEIAGGGDRRNLKYGTRIERITGPKKASQYVAKYAAKLPDSATPMGFPGRLWGVIRRPALDQHIDQWELERSGFERLLRIIGDVVAGGSRPTDREHPPSWALIEGGRAVNLIIACAGLL